MDVPGRRSILAALLNHRSPGVSPGTWESRGMSPTGYPGYPTPLRVRIDMRPAEAVERPHWDVSDKPIALDQNGLREVGQLGAERGVRFDLRVELLDQVLEHLPHDLPPPNSSSFRMRDSAIRRRAVSHEARVCGGREPWSLIHFSRNAIVTASCE